MNKREHSFLRHCGSLNAEYAAGVNWWMTEAMGTKRGGLQGVGALPFVPFHSIKARLNHS